MPFEPPDRIPQDLAEIAALAARCGIDVKIGAVVVMVNPRLTN
ncbi:MAG TPA: hypothetical protein VJ982_03740 [Gemmatimonadota bacterium]|nr:hypothetical protein [Gemmatimonadota bacterium]